ncbi:MAG TPA: hypothetical protein VMH89_09880 [Candidatus Acidoferrum sp.]|nr:hypothetical protein [Candidatus Acidoferrum sp.]
MFVRLLLSATLLSLSAGSAAYAQSQDSSTSQSTSNPSSPAWSDSSAARPSQKKVWTNEDLAGVKGGVSVVGNKRNQTLHPSSGQPADPATVDRIKKSLQKLQSQLDEVNAKLDSYKQFQSGEAVSTVERDTSRGYSRTPVDQQMNQLLSKKKDLTGQISDLLDEARKKGIDPGLLR